jgi:hypothetical protein
VCPLNNVFPTMWWSRCLLLEALKPRLFPRLWAWRLAAVFPPPLMWIWMWFKAPANSVSSFRPQCATRQPALSQPHDIIDFCWGARIRPLPLFQKPTYFPGL